MGEFIQRRQSERANECERAEDGRNIALLYVVGRPI